MLPANTLLHVLSSCRLRMIAAVAQRWQGVDQGSDEYSLLEEGRSKLLPGLGAAAEVALRVYLLRQPEEHLLLNSRASTAGQASRPGSAHRRCWRPWQCYHVDCLIHAVL